MAPEVRMGLPLRVDVNAAIAATRKSFLRAAAAIAKTADKGPIAATNYLRSAWGDDIRAALILKAAVLPTDTSIPTGGIQAQRVLPLLAPASASARVLALGHNLDMSGIAQIRIPWIGGAGRPAKPLFVLESSPMPVTNLATSGAILGPVKTVRLGCGITRELQAASADTAEEIIGMALSFSWSKRKTPRCSLPQPPPQARRPDCLPANQRSRRDRP